MKSVCWYGCSSQTSNCFCRVLISVMQESLFWLIISSSFLWILFLP